MAFYRVSTLFKSGRVENDTFEYLEEALQFYFSVINDVVDAIQVHLIFSHGEPDSEVS